LARTRVLLHLVDVAPPEADAESALAATVESALAIVEELKRYSAELYEKPRWLVLNKIDMLDDPVEFQQRFRAAIGAQGPVFAVSALTGAGTKELVWALQDYLDAERAREQALEDARAATPDGSGAGGEANAQPDDPRFAPGRDPAPPA